MYISPLVELGEHSHCNAGRATCFSRRGSAVEMPVSAATACSATPPFRSRRTTPPKARMRDAIDRRAQRMAKTVGAPTWAAACRRRSPFALATCRSSIIWHAVLPTPPPPLPALARPPPPAWESAPSKVVAFRASKKRLEVWPKCSIRPPARKNIDRYRNCSIRQVCGKPNLWESSFTLWNGIMNYVYVL